MKIKKLLTPMILSGLFIANCKTAQVKTAPPEVQAQLKSAEPVSAEQTSGINISSINEQLEQVKISGFEKNQTRLTDTSSWLSESYPVFQNVLTELPDGYILLVQGHCDKSGDHIINQKISTKRAEHIYSLLVKYGLRPNIIEYKGYAASNTIEGIDPFDGKNRRVSFQVIKE